MMLRKRIALLEDDDSQADMIMGWLVEAGHNVRRYARGRDILKELKGATDYDLLILDWEVPDFSGLDVLAWARLHHHRDTPIIVLTLRHSGHDAALALQAGANDFVRKPADKSELLARVMTATARKAATQSAIISVGKFRLDRNSGAAWRGDEEIRLTAIQFALAWHFFENVGHVITRERLHLAVWGRQEIVESRTLDAHVSNLRAKLGIRQENGLKISALYNYGYRIEICSGVE